MSRTFVIGDIHGAYKALMECFEKVKFDFNNDILISLGDVCDGWPEVNKVIDELLKVKNLVYILGNHDELALKWMETGEVNETWFIQGGRATVNSYKKEVPQKHINFLRNASLYHKIGNIVFVHGGFNLNIEIEKQDKEILLWDRSLIQLALKLHYAGTEENITGFDEVYVGHTPTLNYAVTIPKKVCEIYMMDTGAGWPGGVLSIMNIKTKEYQTSTPVQNLYPGYKGRN